MERVWETGKRKLAIDVTIKCSGICRFRVVASDNNNKKTNYADRTIEVNGYRTIYISFPVSPEQTKITVTPLDNSTDFLVDMKEKNLKTYQIHLDSEAKKFLKFAQEFTNISGYNSASQNGRFFRTPDGYFNIRYYPIILDENGRPSTTPARIGHRTGIIDVSKFHFDRYTIPMRMCILLHEFSHKYRNPKIDLEISNEVGADLNALYIYLGMGYSKVDAIFVFANVFLKAQSNGNMVRMRKIMDYIKRFENQEFAKILTE